MSRLVSGVFVLMVGTSLVRIVVAPIYGVAAFPRWVPLAALGLLLLGSAMSGTLHRLASGLARRAGGGISR